MKSKRKVKLAWGRIVVFLLASIVLFLVICAVAAGYIFLSAKWQSFSFGEEYTVYYGSESGYKVNKNGKVELKSGSFKKKSYELGEFSDRETVYVDFSALAEYCGFYVSGDDDSLRYIVPSSNGSSDSQFVVTADSNAVDLNGTTLHLANPVVMREGTLYMPLEFVDYYLQGISVVIDEEKENVYYLLCSSSSDYYLASAPQMPVGPIDRTALNEAFS